MADGFERSRSFSNSSINDTYHSSPTQYVEARINYEEEGMFRAFRDVARLALPITITSLFISALLFCNLVWIGHHSGQNEYAGAALGNMLVNVMGNSLIIGMTTGLDTQCGQAYGAEIYKMVGVFAQRSICISHFVIFVVALIFWFGEYLLIALGQDKDASHEAGIFVKIFIASLWPIAMFANLRRFLQSQRKVVAIPIAVVMGLIAQIIALIILVNVLGYGFIGACIALPSSYWTMFFTLFAITKWKGLHIECWPGWGRYAFSDWCLFLKLSIPGTMMLCAEWWAFEVLALVAGTMNNGSKTSSAYVAAFTTCLNILGIFIRIPLGISFASAVLVSNKLGAKLGNSAKMVFNAAILLSVSCCFFCSAAMYIFPHAFAQLYTHDSEIVEIVTDTLPYMAVYFWIDSFQRCCAGGTRGMGRQTLGAIIYVISYYLIGMPIGIWFAKCGLWGRGEPMYLQGLWVGAGVSVTVCSFFFVCLRIWVNWDREVARAQKRIEFEQLALENFKADLVDRLDAETRNLLLTEKQSSVNEGLYIRQSEGGTKYAQMEESVSGKQYGNVDDVEFQDTDMTYDEIDHTMQTHTLESYVARSSIGNSLADQNKPFLNSNENSESISPKKQARQSETKNEKINNNEVAPLAPLDGFNPGSLPSVSAFGNDYSTSNHGIAVNRTGNIQSVNSMDNNDFNKAPQFPTIKVKVIGNGTSGNGAIANGYHGNENGGGGNGPASGNTSENEQDSNNEIGDNTSQEQHNGSNKASNPALQNSLKRKKHRRKKNKSKKNAKHSDLGHQPGTGSRHASKGSAGPPDDNID